RQSVRSSRVVLSPRRWGQVRKDDLRATVANKPETPGRARSSRSNHCAGSAGVFRRPVVTTLVWFFLFPREAAGAASTRHSLRPLFSEGQRSCRARTQIAPRECRRSSLRGAEATKQSILQQAEAWIASLCSH